MRKAQRKRVRRAVAQQRQQLLTMELEGLVVLTVHSVTDSMTVPLNGDTAAQLVSLLLEVLQERRQHLRHEAAELRNNNE